MDERRMREIRERLHTYNEGCHPAEGAERRERFEAAHFELLMGDLPWLLDALAARGAGGVRAGEASPGPWTWACGSMETMRIEDADGVGVGTAYYLTDDDGDEEPRRRQEANAALMAEGWRVPALRDALAAREAEVAGLAALAEDAVDAWLGGIPMDLEPAMRALEAALVARDTGGAVQTLRGPQT